MSKKMTLYDLVYTALKERLKEEGLLKDELQTMTEYILHHSITQYEPDKGVLILTEGNLLGVNSQQEITIPRYITFTFSRKCIFDITSGKERTWKLRSYSTFEEIQSSVSYATEETVVIVDGKIEHYNRVGRESWGWEIVWGFDAYIVKYKDFEGEEQQEKIKSKMQLQSRLMQIVMEDATEIQAYDVIQGESMDFEVGKVAYSTKPKLTDEVSLIWTKDLREEEEELMF